jgi:transcription-repair coupling factor (superfamily II helicase)
MEEETARLVEGQWFEGADFYLASFNSGTVLDFLPSGSLFILNEPEEIYRVSEELDAEVKRLWKQQIGRGNLPRDFPRPYFTRSEWQSKLGKTARSLSLGRWLSGVETEPDLPFEPAANYGGRLSVFLKEVRQLLKENGRLVLVTQQAQRLSELLADCNVIAPVLDGLQRFSVPGSLSLIHGSLLEGWVVKERVAVLTDTELFGVMKRPFLVKRRPVRRQFFLSVLSPGSYVVHIEHGVARFGGLIKRSFGGVEGEYLVLEYAAGDRLYVPTGQIDRVTPYIGPGDGPPVLNRLGTQEWSRTKERIRASVAKIAQELLALYASRKVAPGFAFSLDNIWQQELEASFPYIETADQVQAVSEVKSDMEAPHPMDRLVCGDVGYGKTEVALRGAFKAIMDGKQVAVLVPTTILAQQHYNTFKERLEPFPVRVAVLSRFLSEREQEEVLRRLAEGSIDICIGTHRLLQKDVVFKDLGLVVIDEEQRFGVLHKERLKQMRREVDVLTLSATPIPRTLHMSLVGIRDMSTIETPPEERLPIRSYVAEYDDRVIREAILRELERNGQVFFVHNRVQTINVVARRLQELVPEARLSIAHGQVPEVELESAMVDFAAGRTDVLVCTTIIESGLDLPRVNTLIVDNADRLGLTQLYQLRGRVGRGTHRAYAYFLYSRGRELTPEAKKRLKTIFEAQELGAGFHIAMKDLEIRGAGNLLGVEQSGYISAVGFELYCQLLAQAVEELSTADSKTSQAKGEKIPAPSVDLPLAAYLPEDYIPHLATRFALYQRLAKASTDEEIESLAQELRDRFGKIPQSARNLLYIVKVRLLAGLVGAESVYREGTDIVVRLSSQRPGVHVFTGDEYKEGVRIGSHLIRLKTGILGDKWTEVLGNILEAMLSIDQPHAGVGQHLY